MSNKSLAIWCTERDGKAGSRYEAHFNYWRITGDEEFCRTTKTACDFLEIGIRLDSSASVGCVRVFVPHEVERSKLFDCSQHFGEEKLAQGIFNEDLTVTRTSQAGSRFVVLHTKLGFFCRVHEFINKDSIIDDSEISIEHIAGGSLITIKQEALIEVSRHSIDPEPAYFRLRMLVDKAAMDNYVTRVTSFERYFQSGFNEIEYMDFRVNDARTLPHQIERKMRDERANVDVALKLIAFLTAVSVQTDLSITNITLHKLRLLEQDLWNKYVAGGIPHGMMVYHWKKQPTEMDPLNDFSAFVKLQTRRSGLQTLSIYLGIAFIFGVFGNLAAAAIVPVLVYIWTIIELVAIYGWQHLKTFL